MLPTESGTTFAVRIKPNADRTELLGYDEHRKAFEMAVCEPARDGKANKELLAFLKKEHGIVCEIRTGHGARSKLLRIV